MADISYTPTVWADGAEGGTPIDAAKLNNIESGIVDAVAAIGPNDTTGDGTLKAQIDALGESVSKCPVRLGGDDCPHAAIGVLEGYPDQLMRFEVDNRGTMYRLVVFENKITLFREYTPIKTWN